MGTERRRQSRSLRAYWSLLLEARSFWKIPKMPACEGGDVVKGNIILIMKKFTINSKMLKKQMNNSKNVVTNLSGSI